MRSVTVSVSLMVLLFAGCQSAPERREPTRAELAQLDLRLGTELATELERRLSLEKPSDAEVYLRKLALKLIEGAPELKDSPLGVLMFHRKHDQGIADSPILGLPGIRIYVSLEYLKAVETESELAAAIGLELARVSLRQIPRRIQADAMARASAVPTGEPRRPTEGETLDVSLVRPSEDEYTEAIPVAVGLLYRAGYDPRGLVEYWKRWQTEASQGVPGEVARRLVSETYRAIASYTPLRNPVVRSKEFLKLKQLIARI
ncbi:MAG TPA: hypothetical protein VL588_06000 [Bdellovibrionota bacterium]|nr:hypothetical protein [Bdellovibrionota bacterium]